MPRSSAAKPRVSGPVLSDRCLIGATSISIAVMKAAKPPTVGASPAPTVFPLCHSATTITPESATAAINCVIGELVAAAAADLIINRRSQSLLALKRRLCAEAAPCRRTMRQARTFSSTT